MDLDAKIQKLSDERKKNADKIDSLTARNKELDRKIQELTDTKYLGLVRQLNMTPEQFAEFIAGARPVPAAPQPRVEENREPERTGFFHREG